MKIKRFDISVMPKAERLEDGSLKATAIVTRTGVFPYLNPDGSIRYELRLPEEVFHPESMESLKMIPVSNGHPKNEDGFVSLENAKQLQVGFTGETVKSDGEHLLATVIINTAEGIEAVESGKNQLSLGYRLDLEEKTGVYMGQRYDYIQRNIRYNHLALVENARAGKVASLRMDSGEATMNGCFSTFTKGENKMIKVNLDGLEYEAAPEVKKAYDKALEQVEALEQKVQENRKNMDSVSAERDTLKEELQKLKNIDTATEVQKAVNAKLKLINECAKHLDSTDGLVDMSDREIKAKVIAKVSDVNLDEKSDDYVSARYDMALEILTGEKYKKASEENKKAFDSNDVKKDEKRVDAAEARKKMIESLSAARQETFKK